MSNPGARHGELQSLSERLELSISDMALLDRALTHASAVSDGHRPHPDYESLEFVGDAVLGLAVAHSLYERVPERTPGEYSKMRARVVNRKALADVAAELDIAPYIRLGKGEERSGGRQRKALLADCMESLIGTLYLDQGWAQAQAFVERAFKAKMAEACALDMVWDYKSRLQNFCQSERMTLPEFAVVRAEGPDHRKEFEIEVTLRGSAAGRGRGTTKKEAEQAAAKVALEHEGLLQDQNRIDPVISPGFVVENR